ncbi:hypothetical protein [Microcoleus sp. B9-D4]|uniref:hypothetical protein n=1 Tax=Microcoleus sp. B9-D4 TaxID=2818711 RepID=UPI002FD3D4FE
MMQIIRAVEDGVEFFTVEATGESGMSQAGLARLCGVTRQAIDKLINSVSTSDCPDFLKPLQGKELIVTTSVKQFKNATIVKDEVCAIVLEWYAFESQRPNDTARYSYRRFAKLGVRSWIQTITGWQPQETKALAEWQIARLAGKQTRRRLTDAIKSYIDRHPELSENNRKWLYVNASQRVTLVVFGRKAKKLADDLGVHRDDLRNALTPDELILLQEVEDTAIRLIDIQDMHPDDAIQQTAERLLISVQNRALKLK